jgi:hypothetical protein
MARAAAIAFAIFTPVSLGVAFLLSTIVGAYSEGLAGYPLFGFLGAFVAALLSFLPCAFTLGIARHDGGPHQAQ